MTKELAALEWRSRRWLQSMCSHSRCFSGNEGRQIARTTRRRRLFEARGAHQVLPSLLPKYTGLDFGRQAFHSREAGCLLRRNDERIMRHHLAVLGKLLTSELHHGGVEIDEG